MVHTKWVQHRYVLINKLLYTVKYSGTFVFLWFCLCVALVPMVQIIWKGAGMSSMYCTTYYRGGMPVCLVCTAPPHTPLLSCLIFWSPTTQSPSIPSSLPDQSVAGTVSDSDYNSEPDLLRMVVFCRALFCPVGFFEHMRETHNRFAADFLRWDGTQIIVLGVSKHGIYGKFSWKP